MNFKRYERTPASEHSTINCWDIIVFAFVVVIFFSVALSFSQFSPLLPEETTTIHLDIIYLPQYALRSISRMLIGLAISIIFTFIFGTLAAKNKYAERIIIPLIDILQSVPILGFLSLFSWGFLMFFPGTLFGAECAAIFAIFTSQAWNMALSLYQSLKSLPDSYHEISTSYGLTSWQKFIKIELPYATPSLVINMMLSLSASWFFVVASEVINFKFFTIKLPGIGSYIQQADDLGRLDAIGYALITMLISIIITNEFIFAPIFHWLGKFEEDKESAYRSWLVVLCSKAVLLQKVGKYMGKFFSHFYYPSIDIPPIKKEPPSIATRQYKDFAWTIFEVVTLIAFCALLSNQLLSFVTLQEFLTVVELGFYTFLRIFSMLTLSIIVWVPIGVWIGLNPRAARFSLPIIQIIAAFPVNLIYPIVTLYIIKYNLNPEIWVSPLIIMGTQWYILFNVIAGTKNISSDLKVAVKSLNLSAFANWRSLIIPAIMPDLMTGIVTAAGGAWNASIVAEYITWHGQKIIASGIGSFITDASNTNEYTLQALGILVLCCYVLLINRLIWAPLYHFTIERFKML